MHYAQSKVITTHDIWIYYTFITNVIKHIELMLIFCENELQYGNFQSYSHLFQLSLSGLLTYKKYDILK